MVKDIKDSIKQILNHPKAGVTFLDFGPFYRNPDWGGTIYDVLVKVDKASERFVAVEARGFILASALSYDAGIGLDLIRKKGKLPGATHSHKYELEYGMDEMEIQAKTELAKTKVTLVDDVIATGGTLLAAKKICEDAGYEVLGVIAILGIPELYKTELASNLKIETLYTAKKRPDGYYEIR
jgi:adenine phosphoribosyltransferase